MSGSRLCLLRVGDYRRVLLAASECVGEPVALVTVTAPGSSVLDSPGALRRWNRTASRRWRELHDRAARRACRETGRRPRVLFAVSQRQSRGADHRHVALAAGAWRRRANEVYVQALRELGPQYGFGYVDDPYRPRHPRGRDGRPNRALPRRTMVFAAAAVAGRYLTRYLVGGQLERMVRAGDHSWRPLWVAPELTRRSGVTVRRLRRVRHAWRVVQALSQGSRPRMPVWWGSIQERYLVLRLVRTAPALGP